MSGGEAAIKGSRAGEALRDWQDVRDSAAIQFQPLNLPPPKPPADSPFLRWLGDLLQSLFAPLGRMLGLSWPVLQWILIALAAIAVLLLVWRLVAPLLAARRVGGPGEAGEWAPDRGAALALLEDADRLAAQGRFDQAVHLLLRRSVAQISDARPEWLAPASTAREIAVLPGLPASAREAFTLMSQRVERAFYALLPLDQADWAAAREAYARFALERLDTGTTG